MLNNESNRLQFSELFKGDKFATGVSERVVWEVYIKINDTEAVNLSDGEIKTFNLNDITWLINRKCSFTTVDYSPIIRFITNQSD